MEVSAYRIKIDASRETDKNSLEADEGGAVGCGALWENQNPGGGSLKSLNDQHLDNFSQIVQQAKPWPSRFNTSPPHLSNSRTPRL